MNVVRVMECLALLALVVCVLVEVVQDFYLHVPPSPRNKAVEILALIAGMRIDRAEKRRAGGGGGVGS